MPVITHEDRAEFRAIMEAMMLPTVVELEPLDVPIGDYAVLQLREEQGEYVASIKNLATGSSAGRGGGDLRALRSAWQEALRWARERGARRVKCCIYGGDGRAPQRALMYERAGFVQSLNELVYEL